MKRWPTVATLMEPRSKALDAEHEGPHRGSCVSIGDEEGAALVEMGFRRPRCFLIILITYGLFHFGLYVTILWRMLRAR